MRGLVALLACTTIGASGTLYPQARGPSSHELRNNEKPVASQLHEIDEVSRARMLAEMKAWLERLVGQLSGEAKITTSDKIDWVRGTSTCSVFGEGPGVRCIIGGTIPDQADLNGSPDQGGIMPILYFGIDAETLEIQLVLVDPGHVAARSGRLVGDTVDFSVDNWKVCHKKPLGVCWPAVEITAKPSGETFMTFVRDTWNQGRKTPNLVRPGHSAYMELHLNRELPVNQGVP